MIQLPKDVWYLRITKYADKLLEGLKSVEYPENIAQQQVNWIGRSEGAFVNFTIAGKEVEIAYAWIPIFFMCLWGGWGGNFIILSAGLQNIPRNLYEAASIDGCSSWRQTLKITIPGIKPHSVVSFTIDKTKADDAYRRKIKNNIFVPRAVKKMNIQLITSGVYLPVWSFDTDSSSVYSGMLGKTYTTTVGSGDNKRVVTRVRWYPIAGKQELFFDDVLVNSGKKITSTELRKLEPFDTNNAYLYEQKYLAGFVAEHYTIKLNSAWNTCQVRMKEEIKRKILSRYIYDRIGYLHVNTNFQDIKYKYVLVPVWIGVFKYGKKNYHFLVNGTNDKRLYAKLPLSGLKIFFFVVGIIALVILLLFLLILFMNE